MQKYGVLEHESAGKKASDNTTCPRCGQALIIEGPTRLCPTHGSSPFERPASGTNNDADDDGA